MLKFIHLRIIVALALLLVAVAMQTVHAQNATPIVITTTPEPPTVNLNQAAQGAVDVTESAAKATATTVSDFITRLVQRPQSEALRVLFIIGGLVLLLGGWRIYEFIILIAGFLIGASFASALVQDQGTTITIAAILVGGLIGAALSIFVYYLAVFLIGGYIGIVLTEGLASVLSLAPVSPIVLFIAAVLGGIVLVGLSFELLVLLAVVVGAQMISLGLGLGIEWTIVFVIIGVIVQLVAVRSVGYPIRRRPTWRRPWRRATV
jgi:hypothetical protein